MKTRRSILIVVGILAVVGAVAVYGDTLTSTGLLPSFKRPLERPRSVARLHLGDAVVTAEIADTDALRRQGLAGRRALDEFEGMLFVFQQPGPYAFWMQGMKFPLDIIWIRDGAVVDVALNVPVPNGDPVTVTPEAFATQALEVNAGFVVRHNVLIGSKVEIGD